MGDRPVVLVSRHVPLPDGTAAGRALWALREGLRTLGRDVTVWSWGPSTPDVGSGLPDGCHAVGLPAMSPWRVRAAALARPRGDASRLPIDLPTNALVVADDPVSWPAVASHPGAWVTVHHAVLPDAHATRRTDPALVQDLRFERRVARAPRLHVLSDRVGRAIGRPDAPAVPIAFPVPGAVPALPPVDEPVACLLANWRWSPNVVALDRLLRAWPEVQARVPGARLLVAGRGNPGIGTLPGVAWLGEVADAREVLGRSAAVAFPCPSSSGPKVKSLEALVHGRALVTTRAGLEGLHLDRAPRRGCFADLLVEALSDPATAQARARVVADAVSRAHGPVAAARARLAAWSGPAAGRAPGAGR